MQNVTLSPKGENLSLKPNFLPLKSEMLLETYWNLGKHHKKYYFNTWEQNGIIKF
jgi:hypothetical protein